MLGNFIKRKLREFLKDHDWVFLDALLDMRGEDGSIEGSLDDTIDDYNEYKGGYNQYNNSYLRDPDRAINFLIKEIGNGAAIGVVKDLITEHPSKLDARSVILYFQEKGRDTRRDKEMFDFFIQNGFDIDGKGEEYNPLITIAMALGEHKATLMVLAKLLIDAGANVNITRAQAHIAHLDARAYHMTPLIASIRFGNESLMGMLLDGGANIDLACNDESTPLIESIRCRKPQLMYTLLHRGANIDLACNNQNALSTACLHGEIKLIEELLKMGANPNHDEASGLATIVRIGNREEVVKILEPLANELGRAVKLGQWTKVFKLLKETKEDGTKKYNIAGFNGLDKLPINYAIEQVGMPDLVRKLAASGARLDKLSIHLTKDEAMLGVIVELGGSLDGHEDYTYSPLMQAVTDDEYDFAAMLLRHGANPNFVTKGSDSALTCAVIHGEEGMVDLLLRHGAKVYTDLNPSTSYVHSYSPLNGAETVLDVASRINGIDRIKRKLEDAAEIEDQVFPYLFSEECERQFPFVGDSYDEMSGC